MNFLNYIFSPLCGAWLTNEIYNHYKDGFLNDYTDKIKKLVTESALFINDFLIFLIDFYALTVNLATLPHGGVTS